MLQIKEDIFNQEIPTYQESITTLARNQYADETFHVIFIVSVWIKKNNKVHWKYSIFALYIEILV